MKNKLFKSFTLFLSFTMVLSLALSITTTKVASAAADNTWYYNELSTQQKALYTLMYNKLQNTYSSTISQNFNPTTDSKVEITITSSEMANAKFSVSNSDNVSAIIQTPYYALFYDHPELFWLGYDNVDFAWIYNGTYTVYGGSITMGPISTSAPNSLKLTIPALSNASSYKSKMDTVVANYSVIGANYYEKLKNIHDYLAGSITYATGNLDLLKYHSAASALVDHVAVCDGYAAAFKILCDKAGIPCVTVTGTGYVSSGFAGHMWNYVKMEDGKWYAVDLTWDDSGTKMYYDFFLVGSTTIAPNFDNKTFSQTHVQDNCFMNAGIPSNYPPPTLSTVAYSKNTNNTMPDTTTIDTTTSPDTTLYNPDTTSTLQSNATNKTKNNNKTSKPASTTKNAVINANNVTIKAGSNFNLKNGVTAQDDGGKGADLTKKVSVKGTVNTKKAGSYPLTYSVTGSNKIKVTKSITVTVKN